MDTKISAINAIRNQLKRYGVILALGVAAGITILVLVLPGAGIAVLAATLLFYLFVFRHRLRDCHQLEKQTMLEEGLRPFLKDISYQPKGGLDTEALIQAKFLPVEHIRSMLACDCIHATYQAMPVILSDLTVDCLSEPDKGSKKLDFLSGSYFEIRLVRDTGSEYLLWPKAFPGKPVLDHYYPGRACVPAPGELREDFQVYTTNGQDVPETPSNVVKAILRLNEYTPGTLAVQVSGAVLRIFIRYRFLCTAVIPLKTEISAKLLSYNPYPETTYLLRIADAFHQIEK
ncbi:MAG: hypothetical protein LIO81_02905 [Clostridiales bacterium]|nr:hypothetical protein [Clostridiales bacterium]